MGEPEAAVAILRASSPEDSILLIRRAEREGDSWSGHWSFPGGRREPEDPDLLHTALRELEEECGIRLPRDAVHADLPHAIARRRVGHYLIVAPFVFHVPGQLPTVLDPVEAAGARWVPVQDLLDATQHCLRPVPGLPDEMRYPSIDLGGLPLWGFTYRLITHWLGLDTPAPSGLESAKAVLQFLVNRGAALQSGWVESQGRQVATVRGSIPVAEVLARFSMPGHHVLAINRLHVKEDSVLIAGPDFEEYVIFAAK
jgi:8-oxo-dGTP diphosphatase